MGTVVSAVAQHGYSVLFVIVFLEAIGLPVPAAIALVMAGAASSTGLLSPVLTLLCALAAMLAGDTIMYLGGRFTGWWLLGILCRLSLNPEACLLRSADAFYKRGRLLLIFAKFLPGINTMAPPLAGSMNMRPLQFLPLDLGGALLYTGVFWGTGFLFSNFTAPIARGYTAFGNIAGWVIGALFAAYLAYHVFLLIRARGLSPVSQVSVAEVARRRASIALFDVRSHGYYDRGAMRIEGSSRLEPNALNQKTFEIPPGKEVVLYCTCVREATSTLVARTLAGQGIPASVLVGGFRAWKKAGLPLEPVPFSEVVTLPMFA